MIIKKTTVAGKVVAVLMVLTLLLAANCCVLGASADTLGKTIYVKTTGSSTPYIYYWVEGGANNPQWPGKALNAEGGDVYSLDIPYDVGELTGIIVNRDAGGDKMTGDVKGITGNLYDVEAGTWSMYDTNAIKISAFGADVDTAYVGGKVTLSMAAQGGDGKLSYKISANDTVLSDFSAKTSVVWEPKTAGDYTIKFDVKDGAGETNSKTMSFTVKSVDGAEEPIFLSASPANGAKIKTNAPVTVNVNGAGGQVNNKILFYKTEVVDPNGNVVNTAYYQTGSKITFQPELMGEYTVNMYIQNNTVNNTTTMASYTYVSTNDVDDTDSDIIVPEPDTDSDSDIIVPEPDTDSDDVVTDTDVPETTRGDIDGNGKTELKDAYQIQSNVLSKKTFTAEEIKRADVNGDGKITLKDASLIQQYMAGMNVKLAG